MTPEELKPICDLTLELVRLRQNECKHLCVENAAAEIFTKLLVAYTYKDRLEDRPLKFPWEPPIQRVN